jgi:flagellar motor component MotA
MMEDMPKDDAAMRAVLQQNLLVIIGAIMAADMNAHGKQVVMDTLAIIMGYLSNPAEVKEVAPLVMYQ